MDPDEEEWVSLGLLKEARLRHVTFEVPSSVCTGEETTTTTMPSVDTTTTPGGGDGGAGALAVNVILLGLSILSVIYYN